MGCIGFDSRSMLARPTLCVCVGMWCVNDDRLRFVFAVFVAFVVVFVDFRPAKIFCGYFLLQLRLQQLLGLLLLYISVVVMCNQFVIVLFFLNLINFRQNNY